MNRQEKEEINKKLAGLLGLCWHEDMSEYGKPSGAQLCRHCGRMFAGDHVHNPDFILNPTLVLVEMMKREDWPEFIVKQFTYSYTEPIRAFIEDYILDAEGKLALAAILFLEKEGRK